MFSVSFAECFALNPHYEASLLQIPWYHLLSTDFIVTIINVFIMFWHEFYMTVSIIWDVMLCSVAEGYWLFRGSDCLHRQGQEGWWCKLDSIKYPGGRSDSGLVNVGSLLSDCALSYSSSLHTDHNGDLKFHDNLIIGAYSSIQAVSISMLYC